MFVDFPPPKVTPDTEMTPPSEAGLTPLDEPPMGESLDILMEDFKLPPSAIGLNELPKTPSATPKRVRSPELERVPPIPLIIITSPGGTNRIPHLGYWREG